MTEAFYNHAYYDSHYGRFIDDTAYYELKALFWKKAIQSLWPVADNCRMLDYGCGLGQVTSAFSNCHYYDIAKFSQDFLKHRRRDVYTAPGEIPENYFDLVVSSHALEHTPNPFEELKRFARYVIDGGALILILPIERKLGRALGSDQDNHLFAWTFQTSANLLRAAGWQPCLQEFIHDSLGLRLLGGLLKNDRAIHLSWRLGKITNRFRCLFLAARKATLSVETRNS